MSLNESEIIQRLQRMDEYDFERFVARLWEQRGWDATVTKESNDKGIDVIATRSIPYSEKELIQAKRYRSGNNVGGPELQQYASLKQQEEGVDKVVVVSTSSFTDNALSIAESTNVKCIDGMTLAKMVSQLGAEDLVQKLSEPAGQEPTIDVDAMASSDERNKRGPDKEESITLVGRGDKVSAELVGMEHVSFKYSKGRIFSDDVEFEGIICAIKLFNQANRAFVVEEPSTFEFTDTHGNTYTPADLNQLEFEGGWIGNSGASYGMVEMSPGGMLKFAVGPNLPSHAKIAKIRIDKFDIEIDVDHEARKRLPDLPDGIRASL